MNRVLALTAICSAILATSALAAPPLPPSPPSPAPAPVKATVTTETHKVQISDYMPDSLYPVKPSRDLIDPIDKKLKARRDALKKDTPADPPSKLNDVLATDPETIQLRAELKAAMESLRKTIDVQYPKVTLNNGRVEVVLAPTLAMRIINAVDLKTNQSLGATKDPRQLETELWKDVLGFDAGYIEASYPYFEHGFGVRQPAGYRLINNPDGSVTVAMNMRFTAHQDPRHMGRYGRYSQLQLSEWVTLKPGEAAYTVTYRLDNPTPLRRSARFWVNQIFQADNYDATHILYPAGYVMPHGGQSVQPFYAPGGKPAFANVSWFALNTDYGFGGVYRPATDTNSLVIKDPKTCPGLKLYTGGGGGGIVEIWIGSNHVFEDPQPFADPYQPTQFTATYRNVTGFGRVVWANEELAMTQKDGEFFLVPVAGGGLSASVTRRERSDGALNHGSGQLVFANYVAPEVPLALSLALDKPNDITVQRDNRQIAHFTYPLTFTDTTKDLSAIKSLGGKLRLELEESSNHIGAPRAYEALTPAAKLAANPALKDSDPELALSYANICYRYGHLDTADKLAAAFPGNPDADYLRALIAWEKTGTGKDVTFGKAGLNANYMRALQAIEKKDPTAALAQLDELIKARPTVYRPRLLAAYLRKDLPLARQLAAENPASPEAQLVLELLGDTQAKAAKDALIKDNPEAPEDVQHFQEELTAGKFTHPRRFAPMLPK